MGKKTKKRAKKTLKHKLKKKRVRKPSKKKIAKKKTKKKVKKKTKKKAKGRTFTVKGVKMTFMKKPTLKQLETVLMNIENKKLALKDPKTRKLFEKYPHLQNAFMLYPEHVEKEAQKEFRTFNDEMKSGINEYRIRAEARRQGWDLNHERVHVEVLKTRLELAEFYGYLDYELATLADEFDTSPSKIFTTWISDLDIIPS